MQSRITNLLFLALASGLVAGCSEFENDARETSKQSESLTVHIVKDGVPSDQDKQAMLAAKDALFQTLSSRLVEVMGSKGPAAAIRVCKEEAIVLTKQVGDQHALDIGRTGVRLRNPSNVAPHWSEPLTSQQVETPQFVVLSNGNAAALLPIKLQTQCLACHGPKDQVLPEVKNTLATLYPDDAATGFQEGELRGWFWIEKQAANSVP